MLTAQFWLIVIGFAQMIGCSWIFSMFQRRAYSLGNDRFAISLVGAVIINDIHADMAREFCKELNAKESRIRYSVGYEPAFYTDVYD